jgi:hypothetical protein
LSSKRLEYAFSASPQDPFASSNSASSLPVICVKTENHATHVNIQVKTFLKITVEKQKKEIFILLNLNQPNMAKPTNKNL